MQLISVTLFKQDQDDTSQIAEYRSHPKSANLAADMTLGIDIRQNLVDFSVRTQRNGAPKFLTLNIPLKTNNSHEIDFRQPIQFNFSSV